MLAKAKKGISFSGNLFLKLSNFSDIIFLVSSFDDKTIISLSGRIKGRETKVFLPHISSLFLVYCLNKDNSLGTFHGKVLLIPMALFLSVATTNVIFGIFII